MLQEIQEKELGVISTIILNQNPKSSGKKSGFLYRAFRNLDRRFFSVKEDAFKRLDIRELKLNQCEVISINPIQKKYSDYFGQVDLEKIQKQKPDVLIRLGFRILKGQILKVPTLGIWSFHHGDNLVNKGGPPCFWEVFLGWETTGSVLQILSDKLDSGQVIYRSWSRTDPLSVNRNSNKVYWKSLFFVPRNLQRIKEIGIEAWKAETNKWENADQVSKSSLRKPPSNIQMIQLLPGFLWRNLNRKYIELKNKEQWKIWFGNSLEGIQTGKGTKIPGPANGYLADPFLFDKDGITWCFAERFDHDREQGSIVVSEIKDNQVKGFQTCLEEDFHLSYPFLFEHEKVNYLTVESAEKNELRMYKSLDFPIHWELVSRQFKGQSLYDPTICKKDGLYWLFANRKEHAEASSFDELFLYWSENPLTDNWISHPMNPIVSDVKSSRPAGKLFKQSGQWIRPAQDSGKSYGHRIKLQRITDWDKEKYQEETQEVIEANWDKGLLGTHTLSEVRGLVALDTFQR